MHALKVIDKMKATKGGYKHHLLTEISILSLVSHPNVVSANNVYETKDELIMSLELLRGMDLFEAIHAEVQGYTEIRAAAIMRDVLGGIEHLHSMQCAHRDITPTNIVFNDTHHTTAKLIDFGFARIQNGDELFKEFCGTLNFIAPEIIETFRKKRPGYGLSCDMWSAACVLYCMLCAYEPFYQDPPHIYRIITTAAFDFPEEEWDTISDDAKDLIERLLVVEPMSRLTCSQALAHPWCADLDQNHRDNPDNMGSGYICELKL